MATVLQERLKLKQYQIDTWTTREQLCLASAVMRSGDQNWVAVSRTIRTLTTETGRPSDWYSIKNCALQYAKLLELVDAPKRKRERGDSNANETAGEIVTNMLCKQRVEELSKIIEEEQTQYNKLCGEIKLLESGQKDNCLDEMWDEMMREQEKQDEEEKQRQIWLKERKEKILAIQQALKSPGSKGTQLISRQGSYPSNSNSSSETDNAGNSLDVENMDVSIQDKEASEAGNPHPSSPLLTSLLNRSLTSGSSITSPNAQVPGATSPNKLVTSPSYYSSSSQSPAVKNLISTALAGIEPVVPKDRNRSTSGSSTLSKLLEAPPSIPSASTSDFASSMSKDNLLKNGVKSDDSDDTKPISKREISSDSDMKDNKDIKICKTEVKSDDGEETIYKKIQDLQGSGVECKDGASGLFDIEDKFAKSSKGKYDDIDDKKFKCESTLSIEVECKPDMQQLEPKIESLKNDDLKPKKEEIKCDILTSADNTPTHSQGQKKRGRKKKLKNLLKDEADSSSTQEEGKDSKNDSIFKSFGMGCDRLGRSGNSQNLCEILFDNLQKSTMEKEQLLLDEDDDDNDSNFKGFEDSKTKKSESFNFDDDMSRASSDLRDDIDDDELHLIRKGKHKAATFSDISGIDSPAVSESAPSSPASFNFAEDTEAEKLQKLWKNSIKIVWNEIASHKYASIFLKPIQEDKVPGYHSVVYRPMDLSKIKRNIEIGVIKNTAEFQRDLMLMFLNAKMYNTNDHNIYQMTIKMAQEAIETLEEFQSAQLLARASDSPHKTYRRETRESSSKKSEDDAKRKKDVEDRPSKKRRTN